MLTQFLIGICAATALVLLSFPGAYAQSPAAEERFEVGVSAVFGHMDYPLPNTKWASWIADTVAAGVRRDDALPSERWQQIVALGATLAHISVFPHRVVPGEDNVAAKLARAAWHRDISLSLSDPWLWERTLSERRYYHPESSYDFANGVESPLLHAAFHDSSTFTDMHPLARAAGYNAVALRPALDAGSTISGFRRGGELTSARTGGDAVSGCYVLSLRCALPEDGEPPGETADVLTVAIGGPAGSAEWTLTTDMLRQARAAQKSDVLEIVLGRLRIESDGSRGSTAVRPFDGTGPDPGGPDPGFNQRIPVSDAVDISITYEGGVGILLDAVVLSDERAFALFNPGHPQAAIAHLHIRRDVIERLRLLGADSTAEFPALRYLEMAESIPANGNYPVARLIGSFLEDMAGTKRRPVRPHLYATAGGLQYTESVRMGGAAMRGIVDGRYAYLYEDSFDVRPGDADYYDSLYFPVAYHLGGRHNYTNGQQYSEWYRMFALSRKTYGVASWLPPIQNHSWLFRNGWPRGPVADTTWLYEPAAAELRLSALMALCYGAKSMMMYQLGSWPGRTAVPVVRDRATSAYNDMGAVGFLDPHDHRPRTEDTNGESKWDSARVMIRSVLQPLGTLLHGKRWENGYNLHRHRPDTLGGLLLRVHSFSDWDAMRSDARTWTFVEAGEFSDPDEPGIRYLLVINKRVDPRGGRRFLLEFSPRVGSASIIYPEGTRLADGSGDGDTFDIMPGHAVLLRLRLRP
ncbi:MAG: hypothetical protein RRA94_05825 [Bacteroidota bacterium]|nr:hypothetical protein [Bacteroidota bacterium]